MADCNTPNNGDRAAYCHRNAVAHRHITTAASEHTHSYADARHTQCDTHRNTDLKPISHVISHTDFDTYADFDIHADGDTDRHTHADFIVHADADVHTELDTNEYAHAHRHSHADANCDLDANADRHT